MKGTLADTMRWARPTMFFAVPRVWEKLEHALQLIEAKRPSYMQAIHGWARRIGYEKSVRQQTGLPPPPMFGIANYFLKKLKADIGLHEGTIFSYGAAPLKQSSNDYFASLDIPLFLLYGLTEVTGAITRNLYNDFSIEQRAKGNYGCEMRID